MVEKIMKQVKQKEQGAVKGDAWEVSCLLFIYFCFENPNKLNSTIWLSYHEDTFLAVKLDTVTTQPLKRGNCLFEPHNYD